MFASCGAWIAALVVAGCSSKSPVKARSNHEPVVFGSWTIALQDPGPKDCAKSVAVWLSPSRDRIFVSDSNRSAPEMLPLFEGVGEDADETDCPARIDPVSRILFRQCASGSSLKLTPQSEGRNLVISRIENGSEHECRYERSGNPPSDPSAPGAALRQEPPKFRLSPGERFVYQETARETYGADSYGRFNIDLGELKKGEVRRIELQTTKAPAKVTLQRWVSPCYGVLANGQAVADRSRCEPVNFDRFENGAQVRREREFRWDGGQDPEFQARGLLAGKMLEDGKFQYTYTPALISKKLFFGLIQTVNEVVIRSEPPAEGLASVGDVIKGVTVEKGVLAVNVGAHDASIYRFKVVASKAGAPAKLFEGELTDDKVKVKRTPAGALVTFPLRDAAPEIVAGAEYDFSVELRPKRLTDSGFDRDFTLLAAPTSKSTVENKKVRIKVVD